MERVANLRSREKRVTFEYTELKGDKEYLSVDKLVDSYAPHFYNGYKQCF